MALGKVSVDGEAIGTDLDVVVIEVGGVMFAITAPHGDGLLVEVDHERVCVMHQTERAVEIRGLR